MMSNYQKGFSFALLFLLIGFSNITIAQEIEEVPERPAQMEQTVIEREAPPPPPPPPPPRQRPRPQEEREVFQIVERMPRFPGCEELENSNEINQCAKEKMLEFVYANLKYPPIAKANGIEGTVVVRLIVEPDGLFSNVEVVRDIGAGCGTEAVRIIESMPKWIPGKQRGRVVPVYYNMPVKFVLNK